MEKTSISIKETAAGHFIEPTHLMRVDGAEHGLSVMSGGPVAGFVAGLAAWISETECKPLEHLSRDDLDAPRLQHGGIKCTEYGLRLLFHGSLDDGRLIISRVLARLDPGFVSAASRRVQAESERSGIKCWL